MNTKFLYRPAGHLFNILTSYIEESSLKHFNLPTVFLTMSGIEIKDNTPSVSFQTSVVPVENNVFKTFYSIKISSHVKCADKDDQTKINEHHVYDFNLDYSVFTLVENADTLSENEKRKILMVDVSYLIFPTIRHIIMFWTEQMRATPVQLNQINFEALLQKQMDEESAGNDSCDATPNFEGAINNNINEDRF